MSIAAEYTLTPADNHAQPETPITKLPDEALVVLYRQSKNSVYFNELQKRHHNRISKLLESFLDSEHRAVIDQPSLINDVLAEFHKHCVEDTRLWNVRSWLNSTVKNRAMEQMRWHDRKKRGGHAKHVPVSKVVLQLLDQDSPIDNAIRKELHGCFRAAISKLPDEGQSVLDAIYFQGLTLQETAATLSIPIGTVKSRLHKSLCTLRARLESKIPV